MAEDDVSQWIPSTTDDYAVGKVTFTAGSNDITFKDAFNGAEKSYTAGDSIYIPTEGRWLLLKEITSTTKGTLLYPCPESCAGTFDLLIRPLARNARQAGLATMTLRNLNIGNLPGLASVKLKQGQILVASQIEGSFDAKDLNADNIAETDKRKFMPDVISADIVKETDKSKIMTADERKLLVNFKDQVLDQMVDGSIIMCPFAKPAYRMIVANGALLSRIDYPLLWSVVSQLGTVSEAEWQNGNWGAYSAGDGSTTFRIPNLSGEFPRFLDTIGNVDKARKAGSPQGDAIRNIKGDVSNNGWGFVGSGTGAISTANKSGDGSSYADAYAYRWGLSFDASRVVPTANENRPRNIALLPCIRY